MSLNDVEDKRLKSECTRLIQDDGGYSCLCMVGPPPLIAKMFESWEDSYDAYCERCVLFTHPEPKDWSHVLYERNRLWQMRRARMMRRLAKLKARAKRAEG